MIKTFCDACGQPATTGWHDFDGFASKVGVSATFKYAGETGPSVHICDECAATALQNALKFLRHTKAARLYADCLAAYNTRAKDKTDREAWQSSFSKKEKEVLAHNKELKDKNEVLEKRAKDAEAQALLLRTQIATLMSQAAKTTRISTAQINQARIDANEDPDYIKRVAEREAVRRGAMR